MYAIRSYYDGVVVVLAQEHDGQLPELREVERLEDGPLLGGAVAEVDERDAVLAAVLRGEGGAGGQRDVAPDDPVAAEEVVLAARHVHRAPDAAAGP